MPRVNHGVPDHMPDHVPDSVPGSARQQAAQARTLRRERQREATRALILEAALALIDREGFAAATFERIAAELGLTKPGLYYHFASKESLLAEIGLLDWTAVADAVFAATSAAPSAEDALEALVRTYVGHYAHRLERYRLATQGVQLSALAATEAKSRLGNIRPLNDRLYGPTEQKLRAAQAAGHAALELDPRRLAFVAHLGAMGLLSMKLMVERVDDPLRHSDEALVAELCRTVRASVGAARA